MILSLSTHWIAAMALQRMMYCLAEGTALAAVVAGLLRLVPGRNSRTRFAVWFASLTAVVLLPFVPVGVGMGQGLGSPRALLTLSSTGAEYIVLAWASLAGLGLLRVAASLGRIHRLRNGCVAVDPRVLGPELRATIDDFSKRRRISILVSSRLNVPTAIGFLRPAILVPAWLADESQAEELRYVVLHELAHLQRWDDWTNLAQKLVKAALFFHPGVWWIERRLSLDREMACDDAVLAQTGSPRVYARCLARVAEKSFLRRQMSLAQAAVDRMSQLSLRVTRILDGNRPRSTRLWKPAIPMVAAIALVCAISTSSTKDLVGVSYDQPVARSTLASTSAMQHVGDRVAIGGGQAIPGKNVDPFLNMAKFSLSTARPQSRVTARPASLKSPSSRSSFVPARLALSKNFAPKAGGGLRASSAETPDLFNADRRPPAVSAQNREDRSHQYGVILLVVAGERLSSSGSITWRVNMWELRLTAPASHPTKPIPRKT